MCLHPCQLARNTASVGPRGSWPGDVIPPQRLRLLAQLRRVRDRIDREYALPLHVEALARDVNMSAQDLSREFRRAYGDPPYAYVMTRRTERHRAGDRTGQESRSAGARATPSVLVTSTSTSPTSPQELS